MGTVGSSALQDADFVDAELLIQVIGAPHVDLGIDRGGTRSTARVVIAKHAADGTTRKDHPP